jgi:predicted chitinase
MYQISSVIVAAILATVNVADSASSSPRATKSVRNIFSREMFDNMFSGRHNSGNCANGIRDLTYDNFVSACEKFYPDAFTAGTDEQNKRELAAFLGQVSQETSGWWAAAEKYDWGMCYTEEVDCKGKICSGYTDWASVYEPVAGQSYHGRGALQVTWNSNYGQVSEMLYGDAKVLLQNPGKLVENGEIMFRTSLWFWMTPQGVKPSAHQVMLNLVKSEPCRPNGFGAVTNIINGGLECGEAGIEHHEVGKKVYNRIAYYKRYCEMLGVQPGEYTQCKGQLDYTTAICPTNWVTGHDNEEQPSNVASGSNKSRRCGVTWENANSICGDLCVTNADCKNGESCWKDLATNVCPVDLPEEPVVENPIVEEPVSTKEVAQPASSTAYVVKPTTSTVVDVPVPTSAGPCTVTNTVESTIYVTATVSSATSAESVGPCTVTATVESTTFVTATVYN